jgi:hypothetical protein
MKKLLSLLVLATILADCSRGVQQISTYDNHRQHLALKYFTLMTSPCNVLVTEVAAVEVPLF